MTKILSWPTFTHFLTSPNITSFRRDSQPLERIPPAFQFHLKLRSGPQACPASSSICTMSSGETNVPRIIPQSLSPPCSLFHALKRTLDLGTVPRLITRLEHHEIQEYNSPARDLQRACRVFHIHIRLPCLGCLLSNPLQVVRHLGVYSRYVLSATARAPADNSQLVPSGSVSLFVANQRSSTVTLGEKSHWGVEGQ